MSVLLMRLAGPMQSWGTRSRFIHRDTEMEPSKSGLIGMLCAALGWPRDAVTFSIGGSPYQLEQLSRMFLMAVRVDRKGRLMRDYHTTQNVRRSSPSKGILETVPSDRFYLADADFLVGLEGDRGLLETLAAALQQPVWTLFLGRKSFVPSLPVSGGVVDGAMLEVLKKQPWYRQLAGEEAPQSLPGIVEVEFGKGVPRQDVPLSFISDDRRFGLRHVDPNYRFDLPASSVRNPL